MVFSITMWLERETGGNLNQKEAVHVKYCHIQFLSYQISQNRPLAAIVHSVHCKAVILSWADSAQFAGSLIWPISPLSFLCGNKCVV